MRAKARCLPKDPTDPAGLPEQRMDQARTPDPVEVVLFPSPPPGGVQVVPGNTSTLPANMFTAGVTDQRQGEYRFSEGISAAANAPPGTTPFQIAPFSSVKLHTLSPALFESRQPREVRSRLLSAEVPASLRRVTPLSNCQPGESSQPERHAMTGPSRCGVRTLGHRNHNP